MKQQQNTIRTLLSLSAILALLGGCATNTGKPLSSSNEAKLNAAATSALENLYAVNPTAKSLGPKAQAILIFPDVLKGGFMFGGELGNGVLREQGQTTGYYNLTAASYGFQAGLQSFGYAMFFMTDSALNYLRQSGGWEIGAGPSIVLVDEGMARTMTTTTAREDVYGFVFSQSGLMGGVGLQGSKITKIQR
ncbi:MAG TPA: lipid-binding SYLF domain-containing protein [Candidatus Sulfotelmatobacter sp.]|nr:lipid-binding SYLF domain-containing protein [Candidatus Sulfotelmatobacter sp.]